MTRFWISYMLVIVMFQHVKGQVGLQDATGQSKFFPAGTTAGWVSLNTSSSSVKLGFTAQDHSNNSGYTVKWANGFHFIGFEVTATPKNGIANILTNQNLVPGVGADANLGIIGHNTTETNIYSIFLRPTIAYNQYAVVQPATATTNPSLLKTKKWEPGVELDINYRINQNVVDTTNAVIFWATSVGVQKTSNYAQLSDASFNTIITTGGSVQVVSTQTAKTGTFKEYVGVPFTFDFAVTPILFKQKTLGFNLFSRNTIIAAQCQSNLGGGIYFSDPSRIAKIVGGIGYQYNDLFNVIQPKSGSYQRSVLFLYVGYAIGKTKP